MRLGIGSYTFTWAVGVAGHPLPSQPLRAEGLIAEAQRLGVSVLQICDNLPLHELPSKEMAGLRARVRDARISLQPGTRGTEPAHLRKYLEIAAAFGAPLVRSMVTDRMEQAERDLRAVLPEFEKARIVLALENYEKHPVNALAGLIESIGSPCLGACLDTVNSLGALEPPREALASLLPHAACLHVKDFSIVRAEHRMGFSVIGTPVGAGSLDVPGLLAAARGNGWDPDAILELWTPWAGTAEETVRVERQWAEQSIRLLRRYIES